MAAPNTLTATELAQQIDAGTVTAEAIVRAHLERIDKRDADVLAWSHLARDAALERARLLDRGPRTGPAARHPDGREGHHRFSYDQPTTYGSPIYKTHQPLADAATIALARDAGAILLGKTVTTEFANRHPGKTRNPHNPAHTPGGSSSGLGGGRRRLPGRAGDRHADRRLGDPARPRSAASSATSRATATSRRPA